MERQDTSDPAAPAVTGSTAFPTSEQVAGEFATSATDDGPADYQSALDYLYQRIDYEKIGHAAYSAGNYRLDRMRELLVELGQPHLAYPVIHIAGTKGKGSTAILVSDGLSASGKRVGLVSSPHLLKLEERIQLDRVPCSPAELIALTRQASQAASRVEQRGFGQPTFFELTTAMGLLYFAQKQADAVVLEVGLGGRLDSTNVCQPAVSVITSISLDHQAQLGDTIAQIAGEKAGIIKPGVPVICTARHPDARRVIQARAEELNAPLMMLDTDFSATWSLAKGEPTAVAYVNYLASHPNLQRFDSSNWPTRMLGPHQAANYAAAISVLALLESLGWKLSLQPMIQRMSESQAPARLEVVGQSPLRILDTAHNEASIRAGVQAIALHYPKRNGIVVLSASRDKDFRQMLRELAPICNELIVTQFQRNPRAVPVAELRETAESILCKATTDAAPKMHSAETPAAAWRLAIELASAGDLIYATGSFFLAAEVLESLAG